jgi:hypothetical protein
VPLRNNCPAVHDGEVIGELLAEIEILKFQTPLALRAGSRKIRRTAPPTTAHSSNFLALSLISQSMGKVWSATKSSSAYRFMAIRKSLDVRAASWSAPATRAYLPSVFFQRLGIIDAHGELLAVVVFVSVQNHWHLCALSKSRQTGWCGVKIDAAFLLCGEKLTRRFFACPDKQADELGLSIHIIGGERLCDDLPG